MQTFNVRLRGRQIDGIEFRRFHLNLMAPKDTAYAKTFTGAVTMLIGGTFSNFNFAISHGGSAHEANLGVCFALTELSQCTCI